MENSGKISSVPYRIFDINLQYSSASFALLTLHSKIWRYLQVLIRFIDIPVGGLLFWTTPYIAAADDATRRCPTPNYAVYLFHLDGRSGGQRGLVTAIDCWLHDVRWFRPTPPLPAAVATGGTRSTLSL